MRAILHNLQLPLTMYTLQGLYVAPHPQSRVRYCAGNGTARSELQGAANVGSSQVTDVTYMT